MNSHENLIRIILLSLMIYAGAALLSASHELSRAKAFEQELSAALKAMEEQKLLLQQELDKDISEEELAQLARHRLGLVLPGEKIFYFTTDREE